MRSSDHTGRSCTREQLQLGGERGVGGLDARRPGGANDGPVDVGVGCSHRSPRRAAATARGGESRDGVVHGAREASIVALEREVCRFELERGSQLVQALHACRVESCDGGAAVRLDTDEPVLRDAPKSRTQRVA